MPHWTKKSLTKTRQSHPRNLTGKQLPQGTAALEKNMAKSMPGNGKKTFQGMYALDTFTPVVSVGLEHELHTAPVSRALLRGSLASPSLAAQICYQKFFLALPLYRQEQSFANFGLTLSRQTMCNWVLRFAFDYFGPIYDHLKGRLLSVAYHQCDETPLRVLRDGRPAGAKSYMWVHITSELLNTSPIYYL